MPIYDFWGLKQLSPLELSSLAQNTKRLVCKAGRQVMLFNVHMDKVSM